MKKQQVKTKKRFITLLINSAHYFLQHVLIMRENKQYRLLVIHNKRKLMDNIFKNMKGARVSFSKSFTKRRYESTRAEWSKLYQPEPGWLAMILSCR